MIELRS